jgi:WhiB family redox-sensing transcriptional regulator
MSTRRQSADLPRPSWGWQENAACRGEDTVLFFGPDGERQPEREEREKRAKVVCAGCPVRGECLGYAVSRPEKYGTWGGLNEDERQPVRRKAMRKANAA